MKTTTFRWLIVTLAVTALAPPAGAWHGKGHHRAADLALMLLPDSVPGFVTDRAELVTHMSVEPDNWTNPIAPAGLHAATAPEHYFDMELLDGNDVPAKRYELIRWCVANDLPVYKVGLLPYSLQEWTQRLTVAFAEYRKWPENPQIQTKCALYAGVLSHYAADLCMPLHTTVHYDGRLDANGKSPHSGIHLKVDALLGKLPAPARPSAADRKAVEPFKAVFPAVLDELRRSHKLVDRVYAMEANIPAYDQDLPAGGAVRAFAEQRLQAAGVFTARLIATAWRDSAEIKLPKWHTQPAVKETSALTGRPDYRHAAPAGGPHTGTVETVRVATWNVEHFMKLFDQARMPERSRDRTELFGDDEDLFEIAATWKLPRFDADIVGLQEAPTEAMLKKFNAERLDGQYAYVRSFTGNAPGQQIALLARKGFDVLEVRDRYHLEADPVEDPNLRSMKRGLGGNRLFSRGPVFVKFRTPAKRILWVGVTHAKSKFGDSPAVVKWRIRELARTRQIAQEILAEDPNANVVVMGDFNDSFGKDRNEETVGRDALAEMLAGPADRRLTALTRPLAESGQASYHCRIKPAYLRSMLDHVFLSGALAPQAARCYLIDAPIAAVASDHLPVVTVLELREPASAAE